MRPFRFRLAALAASSSALLAAVTPLPARSTEAAPVVGRAAAGSPAPQPADTPLTTLPYTPVLDTRSLDRGADPCENFYQYACGGWQKNNPIPPDQASWDVYTKLTQDNKRLLWSILQQLGDENGARTVSQQKIGDAFEACTNEDRAQSLGAAPMQPLLDRIAAMRTREDLPAALAALQLATGDDGLLFSFGSGQDYGDSTRMIAFASAGGLGLPDRDYYLKTDAGSRRQRDAYLAHVARMFALMGDPPETAAREAGVVLSIETALARHALTLVAKNDSHQLFHVVDLHGLQAITPHFDWQPYLAALGLAGRDRFNVSEPAFYRALDAQLRTRSLADLRTYLRWHVAHASAPYLASPFVDEDFGFFGRTLRGVPQLAPRWQRCVTLVDSQLGDALGQEFVKITFSPALKAQTQRLTAQIEAAMDGEIRHLDWMGPATKAKALEKLHAIVNKIGYPDKWQDYAALAIRPDDLLGNVQRGNAFEMRRQLARIGKPIDRGEWAMTPPTVNAYYDAQMNGMNFPAGVLQPPLFDARLDDAPNYGDTGATIGHELTHGFDDDGRQYDASGTLKNWWTKKDADEFTKRTQCLVDQYDQYVVVDDLHVNGRLTLGENLADFGGAVLALIAWKAQAIANPPPATLDGFTPEQRFFIGNAQWACENSRPEQERLLGLTDPHSPNRFRVNGVVANFKEFETAFNCQPGQPMAPVARCRIW